MDNYLVDLKDCLWVGLMVEWKDNSRVGLMVAKMVVDLVELLV